MLSMREHIDWLDGSYLIFLRENGEVTGLGSRIATHIDHPLRGGIQNNLCDIGMYSCTRRIEDNNIRAAVFLDKSGGEDILHVARIKDAILYPIRLGIDPRVVNRLRNIFNTNDFPGSGGNELGNRTGSGIKVIRAAKSRATL